MPKIAINGFGRIGRSVLRTAWNRPGFDIIAINDLSDAKTLAHLLQYDTNYGKWEFTVKPHRKGISIDGKVIPLFAEKDPSNLPWKKKKVDIVIEATGFFLTQELAQKHIDAGAKNVIVSAPAKDNEMKTFVLGANADQLKDELIFSNASCTTNSTAPVLHMLDSAFGVKKAMLTTVHGYTATQRLVDGIHKDLRRARAAAVNIIPTTTGAAIATTKTLPQLQKRFDGIAIRVPIPTVSLSDITMVLKKKTTVENLNKVIKKMCRKKAYKGIVDCTEEPLVSSDYVGNPHSAIIDLPLTRVVDGDLVKIVAWYDNEWGTANRLVDMALKLK